MTYHLWWLMRKVRLMARFVAQKNLRVCGSCTTSVNYDIIIYTFVTLKGQPDILLHLQSSSE